MIQVKTKLVRDQKWQVNIFPFQPLHCIQSLQRRAGLEVIKGILLLQLQFLLHLNFQQVCLFQLKIVKFIRRFTTGEEVPGEPVYGRYGHPSRSHLEQTLASLESSSHCLVFSSGMAASHALLQTLTPGDHIVAGISLYGGVLNLIRYICVCTYLSLGFFYHLLTISIIRQMRDVGIFVTFVSTSNPENISNAVKQNTKLIWLEVCSNPSLQLLDIKSTVDG